MGNELTIYEKESPLTAEEVLAQVRLIQTVMKAVMERDVHYGIIPGTPKPTLYKPGSEKILSTFHIGVEPDVEDLSTFDEARFRVKAKGFSQRTGALLGVGIGECSSSEEKYKWRKPVCEEEFNETPEDRKREVWKKYQGKAEKIKQVRMNPVDVANTIVKMAKKRAQIDLTLTVTAASDIFDQDLEDLPEGMDIGNGKDGKPPVKMPTEKKNATALPSVTVALDKVDIKRGTSNNKNWTLYVLHAGEQKYSTFSDTLGKLAQQSIDEKVNAVIAYTQTEKGRNVETLTLEEGPEPGSEG